MPSNKSSSAIESSLTLCYEFSSLSFTSSSAQSNLSDFLYCYSIISLDDSYDDYNDYEDLSHALRYFTNAQFAYL